MLQTLMLSIGQLLLGLVFVGALTLFVLVALRPGSKHDHGDAEYCPICHDRLYNGLW